MGEKALDTEGPQYTRTPTPSPKRSKSEAHRVDEVLQRRAAERQKGDRGPRGRRGRSGEQGEKGDVGEKGEKGDPGESSGFDAVALTDFNSAYNRAAGAHPFIAQKQVLAIDSIYTEAKKPDKPDLETELLVSLALGALGGVVGVLGTTVARTVEKSVANALTHEFIKMDVGGEQRWVRELSKNIRHVFTDEQMKETMELATTSAKYLGELGKDAVKDAIKSATAPKIRELIRAGKTPLDAFFEGKKVVAVDSAKVAYDAMENNRASLLKLGPNTATIAASAIADAYNAVYMLAEPLQKELTLRSWLSYQVRSRVGTRISNAAGEKKEVTNMSAIPSVGSVVREQIPGLLYVDIYVTPGKSPGFKIIRGTLPGLSRTMLVAIEGTTLKSLGLPMVFRVIGDRFGNSFSKTAGDVGHEDSEFAIRVDESGEVINGAKYPWHRAILANWVGSPDGGDPSAVERGAQSLASLRYVLKVADLKIEPDKD